MEPIKGWDVTNCLILKQINCVEQVKYCQKHKIELDIYSHVGLACLVKIKEHPYLFTFPDENK